MKRIIFMSLVVSMLLCLNSFAAEEQFQASIVIRSAITIAETNALDFGEVESSDSIQDITVDPADTGAATFNITGDDLDADFSIVETSIVMTDGTNNITVDGFDLSQDTANLDPSTPVEIRVGATAHVNANQVAGTYTGTATFSAIYH